MFGECDQLRDGAWIAVQVRCGLEKLIAAGLRERGYEEFLPSCHGKKGTRHVSLARVLFPGYLFCRYLRMPTFRIVEIPGVVRLVGFAKQPLPIPDDEIDSLRKVVDSGMPSEPWKFSQVGQDVRIHRGPLSGVLGKLIEVRGRERLIVSVTLLRRSVAVEMSADDAMPLNQDRGPDALVTRAAGLI